MFLQTRSRNHTNSKILASSWPRKAKTYVLHRKQIVEDIELVLRVRRTIRLRGRDDATGSMSSTIEILIYGAKEHFPEISGPRFCIDNVPVLKSARIRSSARQQDVYRKEHTSRVPIHRREIPNVLGPLSHPQT